MRSDYQMRYNDACEYISLADSRRITELIDEHDMLADQAESLEAVMQEQRLFYSAGSPVIIYDRRNMYLALDTALEALQEAMAMLDDEILPVLQGGEERRLAQWERDKAHDEAEYREMKYARGA